MVEREEDGSRVVGREKLQGDITRKGVSDTYSYDEVKKSN